MDWLKANRDLISNQYRNSSTVLKELLIIPEMKKIFEKMKWTTLLDIWAGKWEVSKLASEYWIHTFAIDQNTDTKVDGDFSYEKMEWGDINYNDNFFDNVLMINVLSCVDNEEERCKILEEAKRVKKKLWKIYVINMAEETWDTKYDKLLETKKISAEDVLLTFDLTNGEKISFPDTIITADMMKKYCKDLRIDIKSINDLSLENNPVYRMFILE